MEKIELINLTLDEIRRSTTTISVVRNSAVDMNRGESKTLESIANDCDAILEDTRIKLRDVLESVAEFQNAKDMICGVDVALTQVPFDLIYERKKASDYE